MANLTPSEQRAVEAAKAWKRATTTDSEINIRIGDVTLGTASWSFACGHLSREAEVEALRAIIRQAHVDLGAVAGVTETDCSCDICLTPEPKP